MTEFDLTMHWIYIAAMLGGFFLFLKWSRDPKGVPQYEYLVAAIIPFWSACAYLAIVFGQGVVIRGESLVFYARYLDWIVTTPLLLTALAWTAMFKVKKNVTMIAALIAADVVMILSGLIADFSDGTVKYVWFAIGCVALLTIFIIVWGPLKKLAEDNSYAIGSAYTQVALLLSVLWVLYPTIWILSPSGTGLLTQSAAVVGFTIVPIISKVGFSIFDLSKLRALAS